MTKEEFKARWEKDDEGDGLTFDDVAECAREWGFLLDSQSLIKQRRKDGKPSN